MSLISTLLFPPKTQQPPTLDPWQKCGPIRRVSIASIQEIKPRPRQSAAKGKEPWRSSALMEAKYRSAIEMTERVFSIIAKAGEVSKKQIEIETGAARSTVDIHLARLINCGRIRLVRTTNSRKFFTVTNRQPGETA
jgi:hypothetical protein